jgi:GWxTD domain-containing protein
LGERKIEPRKAPCFDATDRKISEQLEDEAFAGLPQPDKAWLTEDVAFIIQPEERCEFLKLKGDYEREQFVEQFWIRRSSNPDSPENDFKEEHYRRIVFANEKYGTEIPGWKSDRGRIYILLGPPDIIDSYASGKPRGKPTEKDSEDLQHPWERWRYRYLEGIGENIDLKFVDQGLGDYRLTMPLEEKSRLVRPSTHRWVDWKDYESTRLTLTSGSELVVWDVPESPPQVRFKDLEAMVVSHIIRDQVYLSHRAEYVKATHALDHGAYCDRYSCV